jgi:hypothetical protein
MLLRQRFPINQSHSLSRASYEDSINTPAMAYAAIGRAINGYREARGFRCEVCRWIARASDGFSIRIT